ncbi:SAF domain-containing protein [Actinomycetospora atypica]|uniref:SAF domain-containing protein n=1 Tax=Actinomycetospora atypica TaxID=1290095 RepID=A0ABV9YQT7_9PSEU
MARRAPRRDDDGGRALARSRLPTGWRRAVLVRRGVAGLLAVLAVVVGVLSATSPAVVGAPAVVAARDLSPGDPLVAADLVVASRPPDTVPMGARTVPDEVVGRRLVGGVRAGEVLTDVRLVGPEAARAAVGAPDAAGVPLRLADPAIASLVRPGALVDVVGGAGAGRDDGAVLASGARVLTVLRGDERSSSAPLVVVALPGPEAARVAAATIGRDVTLTLR